MKCSECKHVEYVEETGAGVCKLNPPQTLVIPQQNRISGEMGMVFQPTNPHVKQGDYDNGGCSYYDEVELKLELS